VLTKDIDNLFIENNSAFIELFMNYNTRNNKEDMTNEQIYLLEIYEKLSDEEENYLDEIYLSDEFVNTLSYMK
jgi:hypothetical protein